MVLSTVFMQAQTQTAEPTAPLMYGNPSDVGMSMERLDRIDSMCLQAIEDGELIHFDSVVQGKWCVTRSVFSVIEKKVEGSKRTVAQALYNLMSDAVHFINAPGIQNKRKLGEHLFTKEFERFMDGNITGQRLWIAHNDTNGWTVMFPEDY